ncbi:MAG TPA: isoprenylcysteine carboxylmethyltransferase family protein [Burkholderiaceae bacterium]
MSGAAGDWLHRALFPAMWFGWAGYWWLSSHDVKATARRESVLSRWLHFGPLMIAMLLLWQQHLPTSWLTRRFLPPGELAFRAGAAVTAASLLFTVWARRHLGRNWSAAVTLKQGHELVTTGPYAFVRHPIYTGLLFAFAGSALAVGEWRGVLALAIALASLWRKLRLEERWMRERFGPAYDDYARRVKALIPFIL